MNPVVFVEKLSDYQIRQIQRQELTESADKQPRKTADFTRYLGLRRNGRRLLSPLRDISKANSTSINGGFSRDYITAFENEVKKKSSDADPAERANHFIEKHFSKRSLELSSFMGRKAQKTFSDITAVKESDVVKWQDISECGYQRNVERDDSLDSSEVNLDYRENVGTSNDTTVFVENSNCQNFNSNSKYPIRKCAPPGIKSGGQKKRSSHIYTFSHQQRKEKIKTLETGLNKKSRILKMACEDVHSEKPEDACWNCGRKLHMKHICGDDVDDLDVRFGAFEVKTIDDRLRITRTPDELPHDVLTRLQQEIQIDPTVDEENQREMEIAKIKVPKKKSVKSPKLFPVNELTEEETKLVEKAGVKLRPFKVEMKMLSKEDVKRIQNNFNEAKHNHTLLKTHCRPSTSCEGRVCNIDLDESSVSTGEKEGAFNNIEDKNISLFKYLNVNIIFKFRR